MTDAIMNIQLTFRAGFLNLSTVNILGQIVLRCGGLSCALYNVWQHPWPLPSR